MSYAESVAEAERIRFEGWDFGVFAGRFTGGDPSWDYPAMARDRLTGAQSVLDIGTGGGELLAGLAPLPSRTIAVEAYPPNVPVARDRLRPLGIPVVQVDDREVSPLPFADGSFDLILNRHDSFDPAEIHRVLRPGGTFLTQQVGGRDLAELNEVLHGPPHDYADWSLAAAVGPFAAAGLEVVHSGEEFPPGRFTDLAAVLLYLRITPWHIPGFTVDGYEPALRALHRRFETEGPLPIRHHRFWLEARKPE